MIFKCHPLHNIRERDRKYSPYNNPSPLIYIYYFDTKFTIFYIMIVHDNQN